MRIDKLLANLGYGSRKEIHQLLKSKIVAVNNTIVTKKDIKVDVNNDILTINDKPIDIRLTRYIKFNKPAGYITATDDYRHQTIMELLPESFMKMKVFPVGRLDKDTEGLIILTNDGHWAHNIINGKKNVPKTYYFTYDGEISQDGINRIKEGMVLGDGSVCKPAQITIHNDHEGELTIYEGKYHQVKRMIGACGASITFLKRLKIDTITLDGILETGSYTDLTQDEINIFND